MGKACQFGFIPKRRRMNQGNWSARRELTKEIDDRNHLLQSHLEARYDPGAGAEGIHVCD